jgi:hypothetical protein
MIVCWLLAADAVAVWWRQGYKTRHEFMLDTRADSFLVLHSKEVIDQFKDDRSVHLEQEIDDTPMAQDVRSKNLSTMLLPIIGIMVITIMFVLEWSISGRNLRRKRNLGRVLSMDSSPPRSNRNGRGAGLFGRIRRGLGFASPRRRRRRTPRT